MENPIQYDPERRANRMRLFEQRCRERGLALTVQRRTVLDVVLSHEDHPTADQICEEVRAKIPDISKTTVYRVLDTLVGIGVIGMPSHFDGVKRFEPNVHRHHHLICVECGTVLDIDDEGVPPDLAPALPASQDGFHLQGYSIHFHGVCAACRAKRAADTGMST